MIFERAREAGARDKLFRVTIIFRRVPPNDLFQSNGELIRLKERPSRTTFLGVATLYQGSVGA